ncbi:serine O-acetyltransferase [Lelliottia sp. WAP21]|uniref:serine O-acetyltransferase n=1 Tax=Lelliottia sp. WAP21 TaxID=2877426 RepID=UPI001E5B3163|nr:serine acetyltransferase [Lelliottia sp. WAP21]
MKANNGFFKKLHFFLRLKFLELLEYKNSFKYYRSFKLPLVNHFTIGIRSLGEKKTFLPHPIGIVIGKDVTLGMNCTIYQNVTIGVGNNKSELYPVIGDNVIIYANAIVLGNVMIGDGAVIGAGCIVTKNVPADKIAVGSPMRILDKKPNVHY